jgi:hypothetical protein
MQPSHWAWQRQRLAHHVGAMRANSHNLEVYELRGPNQSPRGPCDKCATTVKVLDKGSSSERETNFSWYLSSSSSSSSSDEELLTIVHSKGQLDILSQPCSRKFQIQGNLLYPPIGFCVCFYWISSLRRGDQARLNGLFIEVKARRPRLVLGWVDLQGDYCAL